MCSASRTTEQLQYKLHLRILPFIPEHCISTFCFPRRLRDKIIDSERFSLAIDVTGKCGLDPNAVWFAWGLSQLKSGDLRVARENFSKCLTVRKLYISVYPTYRNLVVHKTLPYYRK